MFDWLKGKSGSGPVGLYGKIPNRGDFVKINAGDKAVSAYDAWLQAAVAKMTAAGVHLPQDPVYFVFRAPDGKRGLVGALRPSRDTVGRQYPISVFNVVDSPTLCKSFSVLPTSFSTFLQGATQVLTMSDRTTAGELGTWLKQAIPPTEEQVAEATQRVERMLTDQAPNTFLERALGDSSYAQRLYAFFSFVNAAKTVAAGEPTKVGPCLDCPIKERSDVVVWLTVADKILKWKKGPPTIFWREGAQARLLISFGPAPQAIMHYLADATVQAAKLWPLTTDDEGALAAAETALTERQKDAVAGRVGSILDLVNEITG